MIMDEYISTIEELRFKNAKKVLRLEEIYDLGLIDVRDFNDRLDQIIHKDRVLIEALKAKACEHFIRYRFERKRENSIFQGGITC